MCLLGLMQIAASRKMVKEVSAMVTETQASPARKMPAVSNNRMFGNISLFRKNRVSFLSRVTHECGPIGWVYFGPFKMIVIADANLVQSLMVEHAADNNKPAGIARAFRTAFAGDGLFTSEGEDWRKQRKLMAPAFTARRVASYAETMVRYTEQAQAGWREGATVEISHEMAALTMRVVGKALFDAEVFSEADELGAAVAEVVTFTGKRTAQLFQLPLAVPTAANRRARQANAIIQQRVQAMIEERKRSPEERNDLLSMLLAAKDEQGQSMDDQQVLTEALTLFLAGHETTAVALTWAFYLLANNPASYDKLLAEVDGALQGRAATYADLANLPYSAQVVKEAMRLYPPADSIARQPLHDYELGGYRISRWHVPVVDIYSIHHRPDYYPEPERFNPDRWTAEFEKSLPRYAYMAFGAGPRICIGMHFALMEAQLLLATICQHVRFAAQGQGTVGFSPILTLRPNADVLMKVQRRAAQPAASSVAPTRLAMVPQPAGR